MIPRPSFRLSTSVLLFVIVLVAAFALSTARVVHAATVDLWTDGGGDGLWSTTANWSNGAPNATTSVVFDSSQIGGSNASVIIDSAAVGQINNLQISNYFGTITAQINLNIGGDWNQSSGTLTIPGAQTITVAGNLSLSGGNFNPGAGTVEVNGSGNHLISSTFYHFNNLTQTNGTMQLETSLNVTGTLQSSGTLDTNQQNLSTGALQLSSGSLVTTMNTSVTVSGTATLSSEALSVSNTSVPSGEIFTVLTAGTLNGTFSSINFAGTVSYQGNAVVLTAAVTGTDLSLTNIPSNITVPATSSSGAVITYTRPTATDDSGSGGAVACTPTSGSLFPIGTTTVTCTATDSDDTPGSVSASFSVTVQAALTISGTSVSASEGSAFSGVVATGSSSGTSSTLTASIDWGDGSSSTVSVTPVANGSYTVPASHTYAEEGQQTIHIVVSNGTGNSAATISTASVSDAALSFNQFAVGQVKPLTAGLAALFADADPTGQVSDYQATISWGDGTTSTTKVIKNPLGSGFVLAGLHKYTGKGTYTVTLTLTDQGGSQINKTVPVIVK